MSKTNFLTATSTLFSFMRDWESKPKDHCEKQIDDFLYHLISLGWSRNDIFLLLQTTCEPQNNPLPSDSLDYVCDIESSITGWVGAGSVMRFPEDPFDGSDELLAYVRGGSWKTL